MATLRDSLTPAEQQRFKQLYNQGYFDPITLQKFTERLGRELRFIDYQTKQLERRGWPNERLGTRPQTPFTNPLTKYQIQQMRERAFDTALQGERGFLDRFFTGERTRQDLQDLDRALGARPDGTLLPEGAGLFAGDVANQSIAEQAWHRYWEEHGPIKGSLNIATSMVTGPIRGAQQLATGSLGEHPLEATAEIGAILPIGRAVGRVAGASRRLAPVGRFARSGWLQFPAQGAELADILGAREEVFLEAAGEAGFEVIGAGGDALSDIRSGRIGRIGKIFQGFDPQAAEDAQATESTAEHDQTTGSRTAPQPTRAGTIWTEQELRRQAMERMVQSLIDQDEAYTERERIEQSLIDQDDAYTQQQADQAQAEREQRFIDQDDAYTQQQAQQQADAEQQQAAADEQARAEQSLIDQDEAYTEQQTAEAEQVAYTQEWLPFYTDLAGGSQVEGIRLLNAEYEAGVRDPIRHRYDQIALGLQEQLGAIPSELHRETDRRLRQLIGEKWHDIYRGVNQRPTPQERAARAAEAADKIVEGDDTDAESPDVGSGADSAAAQQTGTETDEETDQQPTTETSQETEEAPDTPPQEEAEEVIANPARVGEIVVGFETDETTSHRVRPVLGDLDDVIPSHTPTGEKREDYPPGLQPRKTRGNPTSVRRARKRAENPNIDKMLTFLGNFREGPPLTSKKNPGASVSGTGRRMTAEIMRDEYPENWEKYQAGLRLKLEQLGIDPAEADAIEAEGGSPYLHYELVDDIDEVALAKDSNKKVTEGFTASETAEADAEFFDAELMGLWHQPGDQSFGEAVTHPENARFRQALMDRIDDDLSEFMTEDGDRFSPDGIKRLENAIIMYVFQGEVESTLATALIEEGLPLKNIENFLRTAIASLAYAKANGQDIAAEMTTAVFRFLDLNDAADRLSRERKQPKESLLFGTIDALYRSSQLIDRLSLLEKQLLYLIYAKRDAYVQLAEMIQDWSRDAVSEWNAKSGQATMFGDPPNPKEIAEGVFTRIIREYIMEKVFETRETRDGRTVLLSPESMPAELVDVREDMDALETTEEKQALITDWIDTFLRVMNEGEIQNETSTDEGATDRRGGIGSDTESSRATADGSSQGTPDTVDTADVSDAPDDTGTVARTDEGGTPGDAPRRAQGATDSVPTDDQGTTIEEALSIVFTSGVVDLETWNASEDAEKRASLQRSLQSLPILQHHGTITAEEAAERRAAVEVLQRSIDGETDTDTDTDTADDTNTNILSTWIARNFPEGSAATPKQQFVVAVSRFLRSQDGALTEEQLIAGYSEALGFDVATHHAAAGHIDDMYNYVDEAIDETLEKDDIQAKGLTRADLVARIPGEATQPQQPSSGAGSADANQIVGASRSVEPQETQTLSPEELNALAKIGMSVEEWEAALEAGNALAILNSLSTDIDNVDAITTLHGALDDRPEATPEEMGIDTEEEADEETEEEINDDLFEVQPPGRLRDITDEQRSDFETIRRKLFLARTIARLEATEDRTLRQNLQLAALKTPQRNDAQQQLYDEMLIDFIDRQVTRLQAKENRSNTEERVLNALTAVQAKGLPEEASDLSLYSDLETPDQAHSRPLAETRVLAGVRTPDTSGTELNLPEEVTADTSKLSPAQQTSVKAIIAAFLRKIHTSTDTTVQGGFLLADKPGVGKTRQALAAIWHYMREGVPKHFIIAPDKDILGNFSKDMNAMGGNAADISHYDSQNQQLTTPIGTGTYAMIIRKPSLTRFATAVGNQNAIADIVEHLTGARPTFRQTHPQAHQAMREAFARIFPNEIPTDTASAVAELIQQAQRINLDSPANVQQFRQRVTPELADMLLAARGETGQQELIAAGAEGSELYSRVGQLLAFGQNILNAEPDPDFTAKAEAFEGVIVFDEMHKAAGTSSQIGRTLATLNALLPNARHLYMSATPFKEVDNFWVADRLGLWGANQPFPSFPHFRRAFRRAARAAKEVIPLHLKQIGRYISRALSSRDTRYTPVEVPLTDTEKAQYDAAVGLVQSIRQRFEGAIDAAERSVWGNILDADGAFHLYRAHYMKMYYNTMQVFFLALLDSMKAQGIESSLREQLQAGDKVIVQLENTWSKTIERARERKEGTIGPLELLIDFVENDQTFPVHEYQSEIRTRQSDGSHYIVVIPRMEYNADGEQVRTVDPTLKRLQSEMIAVLQTEMARVDRIPFAADIIHAIASEAGVASGEISGRSEIFIGDRALRMPQDTQSRDERSDMFSSTTDLNLIVLGPAGLTGINLPVLDVIKDQVDNFYHYLLQSSWNVNTFEQGLGRGKRSNSAIDPQYQIIYQDLPGADRVLGATLAKFAEMGALAGQADNALMQNIDKVEGETNTDDDPEADVHEDDVEADVLDETPEGERSHVFGVHGREALEQLWLDMLEAGDMTIADTLGLKHPELAGATGYVDPDTVPPVQQFFQRLLHQPTAIQPQIYAQFEDRLKRIIAYRRELGQLDVGANDLNSSDGRIVDRLTIYTDPDTGQTAEMVKLAVKRKLPRRSWEFAKKVIDGEPGYEQHGRNFVGYYQDNDFHVWAVFEAPPVRGQEPEFVRWGPRGTPIQGIHQGQHRMTTGDLQGMKEVDAQTAQQLWVKEDAEADTTVDSEMYMATGLILPKWQDLSTQNTRHALMGVIPMVDGSQLHGRVIPSGVMPEVLGQIGGVDPNYFDPENKAEAPPLPEDPNIDIPALVREIVGEATDPNIRARLENIVEHIHQKLPLRLRGHQVRDAAEAALLGQLIRDPQVEHVWIVYRREGRIAKIEPMSLNRKGEADAGDFNHIKSEAGRLKADAVLRIHNHPSGVARWSQADKSVAMQWHTNLGTLMAEDIIVDSGTYAYRTFENGTYTWHEDIALDTTAAEWNTSTKAVQDEAGELRRGDPLYQNPLIRGVREAAQYMWNLKRDMSAVELVFVSKKDGKIMETITDTHLRSDPDPAAYMERVMRPRRDQLHGHVMMWGDDSIAEAVSGVEGVDSVWVGSQRITGKQFTQARGDQTITREIGGKSETFVKISGNVSDPNAPEFLTKPVVIAGTQHDLVRDEERENVALDNRTRGDAEHIVSAKQRLDVDRLDAEALDTARQTILTELAESEAPLRERVNALTTELNELETFLNALKVFMEDFSGITAREALTIIEATPALQTPEVKSIFEAVDPTTRTYDFNALDQLWDIRKATTDRFWQVRNDLLKAEDVGFIDTAIIEEVGRSHTELSENETFRRELENLQYSSTVGEALDKVAEIPILQTKNVTDLFKGLDRDTWVYDTNIRENLRAMRDTLWNRQSGLKDRLRELRGRMDGWSQRALFDMVEELYQTRRMSIGRIEEGVGKLTEDAQGRINPLLDRLWGHISTEKGVYDTVAKSGKILALSPTGDPNVNQGLLAYTSYSAYYRRSEGFHDYGFILDMEKLLEIPGTTGTVHDRGDWSERATLDNADEIRQAMEAYHDPAPGSEDIVIEIRTPQDIDINEYLIGVIENGEVYVKAEYHRDPNIANMLSDYTADVQKTNPDSAVYRVHAPENLTMEGRGRAKIAEIGEKAMNTFIDSNAGIMKVLNAWTPTARRWARKTKNEFVSGFGRLTDLEAPDGSDAPAPADVIKEVMRERQYISKLNAGRALATLEPHLLEFNKLARKRVRRRTQAGKPGTRKAKRTELSKKVWDFIEYNTPIENDAELLAVAESLKEAWRELLIYDTEKIVELMSELEKINEKLYVTDPSGKQTEWFGVPFDGFVWDAENKAYTKDGKSYTIAEAHKAANRLYMPHYFRGESPLQEYSKLQKVLDGLNALLTADSIDAAALQPFEVTYDTATQLFTHAPTGHTASTPYEMVRIVQNYLANEDAALQGILNYYDDEGRVGYYGHLERTRETDDRFYARDISLMAENRVRLWDRLAEVATIGQQHPLLGDSPRMKTLIEQVMNFNKTPREAAIRNFVEALNSGQEGMFERLPQFASGVDVALDIMQHWMERDADGNKTGNYQEIDIARMGLDADTLTELERIGLIQQTGGGYQIAGADTAQRHATMAQHIHEFYNTLALRRKAVHSLVLGLGNWHTRDPLELESSEFWKKVNDTVTVMTLNHGVAIQNLLEIPLISMMVGTNPLFKGLKNMTNADYRNAMRQLARGLSHARKFMADTSLADKYLGSPLTFFSKSDEFSRAAGLGIGLENAKTKIMQYVEANSEKRRATIAREMDAVRLNPEVIASIPTGDLETVLEAAEQLIIENTSETIFDSEKGDALSPAERLASTILRSMFHVSDETFKQYDATSLPQFMLSRNPLIRVFMKYKSWMLQQNRLVYNQLRRAYREAKKGNLEPLGNFVATSAMMGLGTGGLLWAYSALQDDDDDKTGWERLFKGFAAAQTFGIGSVMLELAMYAEGNWYQMQNLLVKQAAGPTFSVAAQMVAPVITGVATGDTGDFAQAGEEVVRRLPIISFSRRVGGWRLLEEATGLGEDEE